MKSYTDLEQSKRLIELGLDVETSDMHYIEDSSDNPYCELYASKLNEEARKRYNNHYIPAWSLSALLEILPNPQLSKDNIGNDKVGWMVTVYPNSCRFDSNWNSNAIDACYEMILKLYELKML